MRYNIIKKVRIAEYGVEDVFRNNFKVRYSLFIYLIKTQGIDYPGT